MQVATVLEVARFFAFWTGLQEFSFLIIWASRLNLLVASEQE